jgi:hypothetical protein
LIEQEPQLTLGLAHPLAEAIGAFSHEERHLGAGLASERAVK